MDFFTEASVAARVSAEPGSGTFAEAIASRYAGPGPLASPVNIMPPTPRAVAEASVAVVSPAAMSFPSLGSMTLASPSRTSATVSPNSTYSHILPTDLPAILSDPKVLLVDLRPHTAFAIGRVKGALGLAAPSTLIRRPAFGLEMLAGMVVPGEAARARFSNWRSAPTIIVYDADAGAAPNASIIHGLLAKFASQGAQPSKLRWIRGGFQSVCSTAESVVDTSRLEDDVSSDGPGNLAAANKPTHPAGPGARGMLHGRGLPMQAFSLSSTANPKGSGSTTLTLPGSANGGSTNGSVKGAPAANPFFDNIRQNIELSGRGAESGSQAGGSSSASRIPLILPTTVRNRVRDLPSSSLRHLAQQALSNSEATADELANQFTSIERAEQRRLMGVMSHHAKETGSSANDFAFGITAGFEKGGKNRYRNIWPFEHSRVHLARPPTLPRGQTDHFDDYVNASYVQPLCTRRRYIATQGPLPATYADFWDLVWSQGIRVMVMLTREMEGAQVKCGKYWEEGVYGSIMLTRVGKGTPGGGAGAGAGASGAGGGPAAGGGFFNPAPSTSGSGSGGDKSTTVRREFELRHKDFPKAGVRRVTQIQYTGWDDMHVPEDAQDLLGVVKAVRELQDPAEREVREAKGTTEVEVNPVTGVVRSSQPPPVLLHCSAGIGRTGGFIALDAALDAVRQEVRAQRSAPVQTSNHAAPAPAPAPPSFNLPSRAPDARNRRVEEVGELDATRRPSAKRMLSDVGVRGPHASSHSHAQPDGAADSMAMDVSSSRGHPHAHAGFASGTGGMRTPALEHPPVLGSAYGSSSTTNSTSISTTQSPYAVPLPPTPAFTIPPTPATADTEGELCYRPPRTLHQGNAPVPLDALPGGAPIYALVADMREQRMSLVQTLRQYVFVHFAVLQGALEIVDEEGKR